MQKELLAAIDEFNALLPNVIENTASIPDRAQEIILIREKIETIIIEKYVYETECFLDDFESIMNNELMDVVSECNYRLLECGGGSTSRKGSRSLVPGSYRYIPLYCG